VSKYSFNGENDENSSCWIRVSNPWAGKKWGAIALPRIGHEVIVDFLEGDPDQPIITGRVYNGDNMPPYDLPANQTQSGMKSRSSKGGNGENFNEIRFEDKKGQEEVFVHAEKDQLNEVENDETTWVGHDRMETVDNDETIHIKHDRMETVDNDETITIGNDRSEDVGNDETVHVKMNRAHNIDNNDRLIVGKELFIDAGDKITLITGAASIVMEKSGKISIVGSDILVDGSGKINIVAKGVTAIKGSSVLTN